MSLPANEPKRLQVINRIVEVLKAIRAGENYFSTPKVVTKRVPVGDREMLEHPYYLVYSDSSAGPPTVLSNNYYDDDMAIAVEGEVVAEDGDSTTPLERSLRDVRRAIDQDSRSQTAGSLGALAVAVTIDTAEIQNGRDFGNFKQRIIVRVTGEWGDI